MWCSRIANVLSAARNDRLSRAIDLGIRYLTASQASSGEFRTYWSRVAAMRQPTAVPSPFVTGMILLALHCVEGTESIKERGLECLRAWRRRDGTFAFFAAGIEPDVDDTCLLNWLLLGRESEGLRSRPVAARIAAMQRPDGLFPTWIRSEPYRPNPVDPCVNVNVLRFLHASGLPCSALVAGLRRMIARRPHRGTLYYRPQSSLMYLASTLEEPVRGWILEHQEARTNGDKRIALSWIDPLEAALRLVSLAALGLDPAQAHSLTTTLLLCQRRSGAWPSVAMFRAYNFWGSPELTTAVAVQGLTVFRRAVACKP